MLFLSPVCNDQTFDANGDPLNGGEIETYLAGSSTPAATYTDDSGGTPHSNPIVLNSLGYPTAGPIWLTGGISYKFIIKNAAGSTLRTIDDISGVNDASVSQSEWVESGLVPTYIDATSFSVPGDQTPILQVNRRLRTTNTSGFIYSTITNSVFSAGITTVTVANDSGVLDAGLSGVAYGLLAADNSAIPAISATRFTMATARMLGRDTAGTGAVEELTAAEVLALLGITDQVAQPGDIKATSRTTAPSGWLALPLVPTNISRTTYANLFAAIGTTWGAGDGSTTFGMPYCPADHVPVQANANVGTATNGVVIAHTHSISPVGTTTSAQSGANFTAVNSGAVSSGSTGGAANLAAGVRVLWLVKT